MMMKKICARWSNTSESVAGVGAWWVAYCSRFDSVQFAAGFGAGQIISKKKSV